MINKKMAAPTKNQCRSPKAQRVRMKDHLDAMKTSIATFAMRRFSSTELALSNFMAARFFHSMGLTS